jgi:hypothetical protein
VRHLDQELVAERRAETVVDRLEIVEIQSHHGERVAAPQPSPKAKVDLLRKKHPVRNIREGIVQSLMSKLLLHKRESLPRIVYRLSELAVLDRGRKLRSQ